MTDIDPTLWTLEQSFWLEGLPAYRRSMSRDAVMVFPEPVGMLSGDVIIKVLNEAPRWSSVVMTERAVLRPSTEMAVIVYRAKARRGEDAYEALCASSYCRPAGKDWTLVHHQQTPVEPAGSE
jgi:hypothetical protein